MSDLKNLLEKGKKWFPFLEEEKSDIDLFKDGYLLSDSDLFLRKEEEVKTKADWICSLFLEGVNVPENTICSKGPKSEREDFYKVWVHFSSEKEKQAIKQTFCLIKTLCEKTKISPGRILVYIERGENFFHQERIGSSQHFTENPKEYLISLYEKLEDEESKRLLEELKIEKKIKNPYILFYYSQKGRCLYTMEKIVKNETFLTDKIFNLDHIYPRSRGGPSRYDNLALVNKNINCIKRSQYPIPEQLLSDQAKAFWEELFQQGFLSAKKYDLLRGEITLVHEKGHYFITKGEFLIEVFLFFLREYSEKISIRLI